MDVLIGARRESWANSGKNHESFLKDKSKTVDDVLEDYSMTRLNKGVKSISNIEMRVCKVCRGLKELKDFPSQSKGNNTYYSYDCKDCRNKRAKESRKSHPQKDEEKIHAAILAAIKLFDSKPEALGLVIKHFRNDFEKLYNNELQLMK